MFHIELDARGKWREPRKFQALPGIAQTRLSLWYLIKNNLYAHCIDIESSEKISHYSLKAVQDFICTSDSDTQQLLLVLTVEGQLKLAWLDSECCVAASVRLEHDLPVTIRGLEYFYKCETIICSLKDDYENKGVIKINSYINNTLISKCFKKLSEVLPSTLVAKLAYKYISSEYSPLYENNWNTFKEVIKDLLQTKEGFPSGFASKLYLAIEFLKEVS